MKVFLAALVAVIVLAAATGFFTAEEFSLQAWEAYSTPSARVGEDGTAENRGWN